VWVGGWIVMRGVVGCGVRVWFVLDVIVVEVGIIAVDVRVWFVLDVIVMEVRIIAVGVGIEGVVFLLIRVRVYVIFLGCVVGVSFVAAGVVGDWFVVVVWVVVRGFVVGEWLVVSVGSGWCRGDVSFFVCPGRWWCSGWFCLEW